MPLNHVMWPMTSTKGHEGDKWEGKKAVITWSDGSTSEFPFKSLAHYVAVKRFVEMK